MRRARSRAARVVFGLAAVALLVFPLVSDNLYYQNMFILSLVFAIGATGLNVISGYGGYVSLGQGAFLGIGAYTLAILSTRIDVSVWIWVPLAGLVAAVFAALLGLIALRTRGPAFVILTISFLFLLQIVVTQLALAHQGLGGHHAAAAHVEPGHPGLAVLLRARRACSPCTLLVNWRIRRTKFGMGLVAMREDEDKAGTIGVATPTYKLLGFVFSAVFVGMAGAIYGYYLAFVDPIGMFNILLSVQILLSMLLGGRGTLMGPVLGAFIIEPLNEFANNHIGGGNARLLVFGGLMALVVIFLPRGIIPTVRDILERRRARGKAGNVGRAAGAARAHARATTRPALSRPHAARGQGAGEALRRPARRRRRVVLRPRGLDHRADRPQRLGQDDGVQPDRRHDARERRRGLVRRRADRRAEAVGARLRGPRADVPDHAPVPRDDRAGERRRAAARVPLGPAERRAASSGEEAERAEALLDFVGMKPFSGQQASALSYGQQKLVELAQVLMLDPKLIMLDEPAGGINPTLIERMGDMIRELNAQGKTFLIVEHNMPFVLGLCDPVLVLARGKTIAAGRPDEIQKDPKVLDAYLGDDFVLEEGAGGEGLMLLRLSGVIAGYGGGDVLQGVDLEVEPGAVACIVGPNGAGKSTVLRTVSRPAAPARGRGGARRARAAPPEPGADPGLRRLPGAAVRRAVPEHHGARERADGRLHHPARQASS